MVYEVHIKDVDRNGRYKAFWVRSNWERKGVEVIVEEEMQRKKVIDSLIEY